MSKLIPAWTDETETEIVCYYENLNNFIPMTCLDWLEGYEYDSKMGTSFTFLKQSCRYIDAMRVYENSMAHFSGGANNEGQS